MPGEAPPQTRESGSLGSGFFISADGYVVTNNHLIQGAGGSGTVDSVTVIMTDRRELPARIIGRDPASDLALLKVEGNGFPFVSWGDSQRARVGDDLTLIGVGGITTPDDARERLEAGATLLQGYTAFIYEGPLWPRTIVSALA